MKTREQYMNKEVVHADYFRQFVTPSILALVKSEIGEKRIRASRDQHLNDIPLDRWDRLAPIVQDLSASLRKQAGEAWCLSTSTCICKQAARMLIETPSN